MFDTQCAGGAAGAVLRASFALILISLTACGGGGGKNNGGNGPSDTTAPDTTITSGPPTYTELNAAAFTFTSSEANSTYEVSIDGGPFAAATSPYSLNAIANGTHVVSVRARDAAGNTDASPATHTWTVAPLPDTSIAIGPAPLTNSTTASFTFASTAVGATFEYSIDSGAFVASPGTTVQLPGLTEGEHQIRVRAVLGGLLLDPTPATATWTIDLTPPTASITFPAPTSYTDANTITVRGAANDAHGVASVSVNGVIGQSATAFNAWTATVPVAAGTTNLVVAATDAAGNVASIADTAAITNDGPPFAHLRAMDVDTANNRILAVDESVKALFAIDLSSGRTSILADREHGSGPAFDGVEGVTVDGTRALVLDWIRDDIIAVDLATGNRSGLPMAGTAATEFGVGGIALDSANDIAYVTNADTQTIIAVDLNTGVRSVVSSGAVGTGAPLNRPGDIAYDATTSPARLLVSDSGSNSVAPGIIAIAISNGNRQMLSSAPPTGAGPAFEGPSRIELDANRNQLLVTETALNRHSVLAVNLTNGDRTEIAGPSTGTGPSLSFPMAIAVDVTGSRAFVAGNPGTEVLAIDLQTRERTVHSSTNVGSGDKPIDARGLAIDGQSLLFLDSYRGTVNRLSLATGERTLMAGPSKGGGLVLTTPQDLAVDISSGRWYVIDSGAHALVSIDPTTGNRTVVSGLGVGSGTSFGFPRSLALDGARALVTDSAVPGILSVDVSSGERSVISSDVIGSGSAFSIPNGIVVDRSNPLLTRALITNTNSPNGQGILAANLTSGDRTAFSISSPIGSGVPFLLPTDIAADESGLRLLAIDASHENLMSVSLANGDRRIVSGRNGADDSVTAGGPRLRFPWSLAYDPTSGIAYVADGDTHAIFAIDIATGQRIIVSR